MRAGRFFSCARKLGPPTCRHPWKNGAVRSERRRSCIPPRPDAHHLECHRFRLPFPQPSDGDDRRFVQVIVSMSIARITLLAQ